MSCSNVARRRLNFQALPLNGKKFYLNIKSTSLKKKVCKRIADLGGEVDGFLSRDVHLLITDKDGGGKVSKIPDREIQLRGSQLFSVHNNQKAVPLSRGKALLLRASQSADCGSSSQDPVENAQSLGVKVQLANTFIQSTNKFLAQVKPLRSSRNKDDLGISPISWHGNDKDCNPVVKVEDLQHLYRPCLKQFEHFPAVKFSDDCGSPFSVGVVLLKQTDNNEQTTKKKASVRLNQKGGYCELCDNWFKCTMSEHLQSEKHKSFVSDPDNFDSLGKIINDLPDLTKFLSKYCSSDEHVSRICDKMEEEGTLEKESALELLSEDVDQVLKEIGPNLDFDVPMETDLPGSETESYDIEKLLSDKQLISSLNVENVIDTHNNVIKLKHGVSFDKNETCSDCECCTPYASGREDNSDRGSSLSATNMRRKFMKWTIKDNVDNKNIFHDNKFTHNEDDIIKSIKTEAVFTSSDHCFENNGIQDIISYLQQDSPQALNEVADQHSNGIPDDENHKRLKTVDNVPQPMLLGHDNPVTPFSEAVEAANNVGIRMEHEEADGSRSVWQTNEPEVDCIGVGSEIEIACEASPACPEELPFDDVGKKNESSSPVIHIEIPCNRSHEKSEVEHSDLINDTDGPCSGGSPDETVEKFDGTDQNEVTCNGPGKEFKVSCSDASSQTKTPCNGLPSVCESSCHNAANQMKSTCNVSHNQNEAISNRSPTHVEAVNSPIQPITQYDGSFNHAEVPSNNLISHMQSTETASSSQNQTAENSSATETETPIDDSSCQTGPSCNVSSDGTPSYSCLATQNNIQSDPSLVQKKEFFNNLVIHTGTFSSDALINSEDSSSYIRIPAVHNDVSFQMQESNLAINKNGEVNDNLTKQAETVKSDDRVNEQFERDVKVKHLKKLENCNYTETSQMFEQNSLTGSGIGDSSRNIIDCSPLFSNDSSNPTQPDNKIPLSAPDGTSVQMTFETTQSPDTRFRTVDSTPSITKVTTHPSFSNSSLLGNGKVKYKKHSNAVQKESLENLYDQNICIRTAEEESVDNDYDKRSITDDLLEPQINQTSHKFEFVYSPISSVYSDDADKLDNLSHMDTDSGQETENYPRSPYCGKSIHDAVISKPCRILRKSKWIQENPSIKCTKSCMSTHNKLDSQSICADRTRSSHSVKCLNSGRIDILPVKVKGSAEVQIEQLPPKDKPVNAISALKMRSSLIARRTRSRKVSISQPMSPLCIDMTQRESSPSVPVTKEMHNQRVMSIFSPVNVNMDYNITSENIEILTDERKDYQAVEEKSYRKNGKEVPSSVVSCTIPATSFGITSSNFMMHNTKSIPVKGTCVNLGYSLGDVDSVGLAASPYDDCQISQDGHSTLSKSIQSPGHLIKLAESTVLKEPQRCFNQMMAVTVTQPVSPAPVFTQTYSMYERSLSSHGSCASSPHVMESPQPYSYVSPGMTRVQIPYREHMKGSPPTAVDTKTTAGRCLTSRSSTSSVESPLGCLDPNWFSQQVQNQRFGFDNSPIPSPVNIPSTVINTLAIPQNQLDNVTPQQYSDQIPEMLPDQPYCMHSQPQESFPVQNLTSSLSMGFVEHEQHIRHHSKNSAMLHGTNFQSLPIIGHQQSVIVKSEQDRQKILLVHNSSGGLNFLPLGMIKSSKSPQKKTAKKKPNRRSRKKDNFKAEIDSNDTNILDRALELSGVFCDGQQQQQKKLNDSAFKTRIIHVTDRTRLDSNYTKAPVPLDGVHPSYVYIQSDTYAEQPQSGFIVPGLRQANLKPSFCIVPVSKTSADNVMTSDANVVEFPSSTSGDNSIVFRDLLDQAESELNDLLIDIGIINTGSQPAIMSQIIEQDALNVQDVNMTAVIQTSAAKESLIEENKTIYPGNNLLKETSTSHISKNESSRTLSGISTGVSTEMVLSLSREETQSTVVTKEMHKDEKENEKHSVDIDGIKVSENIKHGESDSQVDSGLNDDIDSIIDSEEETADPGPFSVLGHLQNSDSSRNSAEKTMQSSRHNFQSYRSKENLAEISEIDLRPTEGVFPSCQLLPATENNLSNQNGVLSLDYSSHSNVKPLAEKNQNVTSEVGQRKNSIRSKCDILSQLNQHKLCAQKSMRVLSQMNIQNSTSVSDLLSQINQYKHDTINHSLSHEGMDQLLKNNSDFYTDSGKESADSEGLSDRTKRRSHLSRRKNKVVTKSPCTYTINKTGETKFKLCKVLLAPVQQKTNLLQLWRVQKQDGCRLVLSAKKRKASGFHISSTDSITLDTEVSEQPQRKRRCLAY